MSSVTIDHFRSILEIGARLTQERSIASAQYFKPIPENLPQTQMQSFVADDHTPFAKEGLKKILHLISVPFPSVWHTLRDNKDALDYQTCHDLALIFKEFVLKLSHS